MTTEDELINPRPDNHKDWIIEIRRQYDIVLDLNKHLTDKIDNLLKFIMGVLALSATLYSIVGFPHKGFIGFAFIFSLLLAILYYYLLKTKKYGTLDFKTELDAYTEADAKNEKFLFWRFIKGYNDIIYSVEDVNDDLASRYDWALLGTFCLVLTIIISLFTL
ncbi:MAG: hypothetical protein HeimC2_40400 [Candidatus Heimdallarchaeota archaeon LC_2]|nr:MAG: hypothetical protein HeimC2_40400 [Candidatus Heimdallarchaeota archaeon LC_2]